MSEIDLKALAAPFPADDIDWRVGRSGMRGKNPWAMVLAYVDARAIQNRLDEVCGPANWKPEYQLVSGGFLCGLSIRIGGEWITKWDGSDETDVEAFKGGISKALVRAASVWGVGRYLYDLGTSWADFNEVTKDKKGAREVKIDNNYYYWIPPALPSWALPESERKKVERKPKADAADDKGGTDPDRERAQAEMLEAHRKYIATFPQSKMELVLFNRYGKGQSKLLTTEEMTDFAHFMRSSVEEVSA